MSCVREASPPIQDTDHLRNDMKKKRLLQPFRAIGRILRRKPRPPVISSSNGSVDVVTATLRSSKENFDACEQPLDSNWEPTNKSHSTSHLTDDTTDNSQRRTLQSTLLSVSHDSVFTSEQRSPDSGSETSLYVHPTRLGFPHSSVRAELFEVIKKRNLENNVSDDEDLGLPRSPVSNSPTTADPDDMFTKEHIVTKSSQSTCSDGSLLSMGSSEMDEESYCHSSRHSSKLSLHEKRISTGSYSASNNDRSSTNVSSSANGSSLSHSAAKHKMAVKPKRNHGAPHKKRQIITSNTLPTTPEVNEENSHKNLPPEDKQSKVAELGQSDEHESNQNYVYKTSQRDIRTVSEYASINLTTTTTTNSNHHNTSVTQINASSTTQSKCASLPAGVTLSPAPSFKLLTRSKSNAANSTQQLSTNSESTADDILEKGADLTGKKEENGSFFSRLLLRRSSKKKKNAVDDADCSNQKPDVDMDWEMVSSESTKEDSGPMSYSNGIGNAMKHHPLFRQRIEPLNLPDTSESLPPPMTGRMHTSTVPINMEESSEMEKASAVKKSHSFRNHEKLPYSCYEDTPSLPVNIGLVEEETVTERFSKHRKNRMSDGSYKSLSPAPSSPEFCKELESSGEPEYETAGFRLDVKWKSTSTPIKSLDYGNISVVNCNKVNINIEDGTKVDKTGDVKAPVPTPRVSLLSKPSDISDTSGSSIKEYDHPDMETYVNVTVTESSGQRSIVSISSMDTNSEPHSPSGDSVHEPVEFNETINNELTPSNDSVFEDSEYEDDRNRRSSIESLSNKSPKTRSPVQLSPKSKPRKDQPPVIAEKPIIVTDFVNGIVKVNDTTVVLRRKVKDVSQSKEDEPELMKVFARRSLKLKEPDGLEEIEIVTKSRDSDKENEDSNSSCEEQQQRPKKNETKLDPPTKTPFNKFQRSVSQDVQMTKTATVLGSNNEKRERQRCRSIPNEMDTTPPRSPPPIISTNGDDIIVVEKTDIKTETTPYKRIQQRREEWEKRAQQARGSK